MLPATLNRTVSAAQKPLNPRFPAGAASHMLDVFDLSRTRLLTEVRVETFWDCTPAEDALGAGFLGDKPFLLYRAYGQGRVALLTSSLDAQWSNFPTTQDFLPFLQDLVVYLSASVEPPINLMQAEPLVFVAPPNWERSPPETEGAAAGTPTCQVVRPDGRVAASPLAYSGGKWISEWLDTRLPGIYTVTVGDCDPTYYAVGLQRGEGNLTPLSDDARDQAGANVITAFTDSAEELRLRVTDEVGVKEWWRRLLFIALGVLCLELLLAWRFSE
jgi:hypothetical protein